MVPDKIKELYYRMVKPVVSILSHLDVNPHVLTFLGFLVNLAAAWFFRTGDFFLAGLTMLVGGFFDSIDGQLARTRKQDSTLGAFLDSVLDRFSEIVVLTGLIIFFSEEYNPVMTLVTSVFLISSLMVSYVKARAEGLGIACTEGLMQRTERVTVLAAAALLGPYILVTVLWVLTALTVVTVFQRMAVIVKRAWQK